MSGENNKLNKELYVPRKCAATNKMLSASDHAAVTINIGHVDHNGIYTGTFTTVAFAGYLRQKGEIDVAMNRIASEKGLMKNLQKFSHESKFRGSDN